MDNTSTTSTAFTEAPRLVRTLSFKDILILAFSTMIGWGWVVSSGGWIQNAGVVGTAIGFIIGGLMMIGS